MSYVIVRCYGCGSNVAFCGWHSLVSWIWCLGCCVLWCGVGCIFWFIVVVLCCKVSFVQ